MISGPWNPGFKDSRTGLELGIQGIFCVLLLMDMTAFSGPIFKCRTIFRNDFPIHF